MMRMSVVCVTMKHLHIESLSVRKVYLNAWNAKMTRQTLPFIIPKRGSSTLEDNRHSWQSVLYGYIFN